MMNEVIPDSIEPVVAWKGFDFSHGMLWSPSQRTRWVPGQPMVATCVGQSRIEYYWEAESKRYIPNTFFTINTPVSTLYTMPSIPDIPEEEPPEGFYWILRSRVIETHHPVASNKCSCGIYMADLMQATEYGTVLARCAGWGRTVAGSNGYRVQYAYPLELYANSEQEKRALELAGYGVPVSLKKDLGILTPTQRRLSAHKEISLLVVILLIVISYFRAFLFYKNPGWFNGIMLGYHVALTAVVAGVAIRMRSWE